MEGFRNEIILGFVGTYMVLCVLIGIWALRRTKSTQDFFMAGRDLGIMVTAFAVFSSTMSGFGFVGGPGLVYRMGMSSVWMIGCVIMGFNLAFFLLGKRLRLLSELGDCISLPDVVALRYQNNSTRILISLAIIFGVLGYLATQIMAMSIVLRDILMETQFWSGVSLEMCAAISCSILVFYSITGGIVASVYTDLVQGAIMLIAAIFVFFTVMYTYDGGFTEINRIIQADDRGSIGPWGTLGMVGCLSWFFVFGLGATGQPHVITKLMMNKKVSDARYILPVSISGYFFSALLWISIGLVMRALVLSGRHPELISADGAASQFLQNYAHPVLAGVVFAGLFAAIMSTADAFLNIGTAAIMHDIPKALGINLTNELIWARTTTFLITIFAALFALYTGDLVAILGAFGWGTFAAAIVPVVALGFNWKRATAMAANTAVIASLSVNFMVKLFKISIPYNIDVGALSLLISLTLFIGISLASKAPDLDPDVEAVMDL
ncbi:MAG: sodium/proline symporter [Saprospiraceae bacterium]|nr:sodium/proline symporter [Saprospiraceae bacterium]